MPVTQSVKWCVRCGAVTAISSSEGGGFDNEQVHAEWHERQDALLAQFQAMAEVFGQIAATYWNQVCVPFANALSTTVMPKVEALGEAIRRAQGDED